MTKKEFITNAVRLGYCTKAEAHSFCKNRKADGYTEEDYQSLFRFAEACYFHDKCRVLHKGGGRKLGDGGFSSKMYTNIASDKR
jgi:hypothetical protein